MFRIFAFILLLPSTILGQSEGKTYTISGRVWLHQETCPEILGQPAPPVSETPIPGKNQMVYLIDMSSDKQFPGNFIASFSDDHGRFEFKALPGEYHLLLCANIKYKSDSPPSPIPRNIPLWNPRTSPPDATVILSDHSVPDIQLDYSQECPYLIKPGFQDLPD